MFGKIFKVDMCNKIKTKSQRKEEKQMVILFFCQHCGEMQECDLYDISKYDEKKIEDFARTECKFSPTKTHILSAVVLPDESKNSSPTIANTP